MIEDIKPHIPTAEEIEQLKIKCKAGEMESKLALIRAKGDMDYAAYLIKKSNGFKLVDLRRRYE
jgi:translation elongation factor EF-Ts